MNIQIASAKGSHHQQRIIENLFHYYVYELSAFLAIHPSKEGQFTYRRETLETYWMRDDHHPFLIMCDDEVAGFSLIRQHPSDRALYDIGQFFVLKHYKGQGVGQKAFELSVSQFPGHWLTRVLLENTPALSFWTSVIRQKTSGDFIHTQEKDDDLLMHFLRYKINP